MYWIFYTFLINLSLKPSFLAKHTLPKFCEPFNEYHFQAKITLCFTTGFMVLNKFIEICTLIKRNLNFKCEVKSHKVRLQAYCNITFVYRLIAIIKYYLFCLKKADSKYYTGF